MSAESPQPQSDSPYVARWMERVEAVSAGQEPPQEREFPPWRHEALSETGVKR